MPAAHKPIMFELPVHGAGDPPAAFRAPAIESSAAMGQRKKACKPPNSHLQAFFIVTSERRPVAFVGFLSRTILIIKLNK